MSNRQLLGICSGNGLVPKRRWYVNQLLSSSQIYKCIIRSHWWKKTFIVFQASDSEIVWTMRISGVVFGAISVISAIKVNTIYGLLVLSSDLVYVILFPQLVAVFYLPFANSYGSLCGIITGLFFRIAGGEPLIGIPGVICYPYCSEVDGVIEQNFPVKTLSMLISLTCIIMGSGITHLMFKKWNVPLHYDVIRCFQPLKAEKDEMTKL